MTNVKEYTPIDGFYDLRDYTIPKKEFVKFWRIQMFLHGWEKARQQGRDVPDNVRMVAAQYQQALFEYDIKQN